jgi:hypothetical protein
MSKPRKGKTPDIIGWREIVGLPELGIARLTAKIDTGARTAALHALDIQPLEREGAPWVSFKVPVGGKPTQLQFLAPVHDRRAVKNTGGIAEERWIVRTAILLGRHRWHIQLSLTNREDMKHDLILGRTAIRGHRVLIDPNRSFLAGPPAVDSGTDTSLGAAAGIIYLESQHS